MQAAKEGNLDLFWKLSESKDNARIEAAFKIVSNLNRLSIKDEKEEFLQDFAYSLRRFVSGLASDRVNSRKGYFTALVQLVKFFPDEATVSKVMEIINKELNIKGTKKHFSLHTPTKTHVQPCVIKTLEPWRASVPQPQLLSPTLYPIDV